MDRAIDLLSYLPTVIQGFKEFQDISEAENPEILMIWEVLEDIMNDQFVSDATENGINRWETILKITPKGTESLDDRKFRIITRLNEKLPYTPRSLEQKLATLCGEDGYSITNNSSVYTLTVRVALTAKNQFEEVSSFVKRTAPANLILDVSLLYNQYSTLDNFTHSHLAAYTHDQLRNEVIT